MTTGLLHKISDHRVILDANLIECVQDWSQVRSLSRAKRRLSMGHKQNIKSRYKPVDKVFFLSDGTAVMHPEVAKKIKENYPIDNRDILD